MIKVLIVDDHYLFAEGLNSMFKSTENITVVAHTNNGNEVPSILDKLEIDVILMDIDMPIKNGIETMESLKKLQYDIPILMLTMHQSISKIRRALEKGAQGYILKDASKSELVEAVIRTSNKENYFHPKIHDQIFNYFRNKKSTANEIESLTKREKEIIKHLSEGLNSKEIGKVLFISEHTVKTHRRNMMHKLGVKTSAELIHLANEKGII